LEGAEVGFPIDDGKEVGCIDDEMEDADAFGVGNEVDMGEIASSMIIIFFFQKENKTRLDITLNVYKKKKYLRSTLK
jgi:hypothetical protein